MPKNKVNFLPKHHRREIIDQVIDSPGMQQALQSLAKKTNNSPQILQNQARIILKEMISAHDPAWVSVSRWAVKLIQKLLFGRFELRGDFDSLRSSNHPILYIPTHRSHMDYLFLSYVLLQHQLPPPIIAAGINLSFFPMGPIFKRLGAFFIRRRISGNATYKICLEHYLEWLVKTRQHIECYPEGGRSRDGMIRKPQSGLVQLMVQAMATQNQPFDIVPVAIGYDFIPDANGFAAEEMGNNKEKESIWSMLKSMLHICQHGTVHFHILPAITDFSVDRTSDTKTCTQSLLNQVFDTIQHNIPITAIQVLCCALLTTEQDVPEEYIFEQAMAIRKELRPYHQQFSQSLSQLEKKFPVFIEQLVRKKWLVPTTPYHYKIAQKQRIKMNYHRHSILHYFLPSYFAHKPRASLLRQIWSDYFPYLDRFWFEPLQNLDSENKWEGLENMMHDILEPYLHANTTLGQKTQRPHPRPENITPDKRQRAKNWLQQLDSDTLRQMTNLE